MNNLGDIFRKYAAVVFFDTETSGLEPETDRIIELAAIRIEQTKNDTLRMAGNMDDFIRLPEGEKLPEKIVNLTGITDELLEKEGLDEIDAVHDFETLIADTAGPVLLVAHNAQFDLQFVAAMAEKYAQPCKDYLIRADYLDSLTVYKDRRPYPHKLANAITVYKLEDKVQNTHRAIDDVAALFEVCKSMDEERADLLTYVNVFGYNPKYGVSGRRIGKVSYWPQRFNKYMQAPSYTLPALNRRRATP
jgi:DNA polymerase-3 subunit epsilon